MIRTILAEAVARFDLDPQKVSFVRIGVNMVYACERAGQPVVLRLSEGRRDTLIRSEIAWVHYLAAHGGSAALPLRSRNGNLVETYTADGETYAAAVFERVAGEHPVGPLLTDAVLALWGRSLAEMHVLGKSYVPANPTLRRPHWHAHPAFDFREPLTRAEPFVCERWEAVKAHLNTLPTGPDGYGLIHADPEPWNIFLHNGRLTFIDFDEACYHWYVFDLVVAALYAALVSEAEAQHVWRQFYAGYRAVHPLDPFWLRQMPVFLTFRTLQDYLFARDRYNPDHLTDEQAAELAGLRHALETDTPLVSVDFEGIG